MIKRSLYALVPASVLLSCGAPPRSEPTVVTNPGRSEEPAVALSGAPTGQLPTTITPRAYRLDLVVDPRAERFSGTVSIDLTINNETARWWIHGKDLQVTDAELTMESGSVIEAEWLSRGDDGVAALDFSSPVPSGDAVLALSFSAPLGENLDGLYRVRVGDDAYAFTQLESIAARKVFPSFDEPRFKTPFTVSLTVPSDMVAVSNTRELRTEQLSNGQKRVHFAPSEPMPTYLVAMAIGPLDVVDGAVMEPTSIRDREVRLRGIAARGKGPELDYALQQTEAILQWLEMYFGTPYPYDKLDVVAVPDFSSGAMENIGLVTFREWYLLVDPNTASATQKRAFANVMAHELAHMWFGNLVTMRWWDEIWLNEAFATWMASKVIADRYPDYQAPLIQLQKTHGAMRADSLASARRIREPIESNHDIRNAFDAITYEKGAAVLEMVEQWIEPGVFREAIQRYLNAHQHGHGSGEDLIRAFSSVTDLPVESVLTSFLDQVGVPLLEVTLRCDARGARADLRQSRYLPLGTLVDEGQSTAARWTLPVCLSMPYDPVDNRPGGISTRLGGARRSLCRVMANRQETWSLGRRCPRWLVPNANANGYYRFSMNSEAMSRFGNETFRELSARERLAVADSYATAMESGRRTMAELLPEFGPLVSAPEIEVARIPMSAYDFLHDHVLLEASERAALREYGQALFEPIVQEVLRDGASIQCSLGRRRGRCRQRPGAAQQNEDPAAKIRIGRLTRFVAESLRHPELRSSLAELAGQYLGYRGDGEIHPEVLPPEVVSVALRVAVQDGDEEFFEAALARFQNTENATLRSRLLSALGSSRDGSLAERARQLSLSPLLRGNERLIPLGVQLSMEETRAATWSFLRRSFDELSSLLSPGRQGQLPWYVTDLCSTDSAAEVERFFAPRVASLDGGPRNLAGALEAIRLCAARADHHRESTRAYLEAWQGRAHRRESPEEQAP